MSLLAIFPPLTATRIAKIGVARAHRGPAGDKGSVADQDIVAIAGGGVLGENAIEAVVIDGVV